RTAADVVTPELVAQLTKGVVGSGRTANHTPFPIPHGPIGAPASPHTGDPDTLENPRPRPRTCRCVIRRIAR
ncbi:hypothetical protein, partial [Streptomyces fagopyri]